MMSSRPHRRHPPQGQLASLRALLAELETSNPFYSSRLRAAGLDSGLADLETFLRRMPLTSKAELVLDQELHPPYGSNLTYPLERYRRFHQTSGSTGRPLRWLDTEASWDWMIKTWLRVYEVCGLRPSDRVFFPFSFGPFLGFWVAFDAASRLGCLAIPGGGLGSSGRLRLLLDSGATALCCTPTYAIHLAEVAAAEGIDLSCSRVRVLMVAGEPGGAVATTRKLISELWHGARVMDHHGMTEVGPVSFPNPDRPGILHINEESYLAEVLDPQSLEEVEPGQRGELVLTTLGRHGSPLLRYRTGDLVQLSSRSPEELGVADMALEGGILARTDDMVVVRGVNLYPSAVEAVLRGRPGVAEYRVELDRSGAMSAVEVLMEPAAAADGERLATGLAQDLRAAFQLRIPVRAVAPGTLPRFELKAKRWVERG